MLQSRAVSPVANWLWVGLLVASRSSVYKGQTTEPLNQADWSGWLSGLSFDLGGKRKPATASNLNGFPYSHEGLMNAAFIFLFFWALPPPLVKKG